MSALAGNHAAAQAADSGLPDAADAINSVAPTAAPPLKFTDAKGQMRSLADYKGHVLVVNIWATWCGPCVEEIPTFATLAGQIQSFGGLVLPISIDTNGAQAVKPFFSSHGISDLPVLLDPDGNNLDVLGTDGVPVTLVVDPQGRMVGRLDGAANWDTPGVLSLLLALAPVQGAVKPPHVTAL